MKWFKHDTAASRNEKLAMLKATSGLEGYGFYWNVLEIIAEKAEEVGESAGGSVRFPLQSWCGFVGVSPQTFRKLAGNCQELGLFSVSFSEVSGKEVAEISTDGLEEIADEYSTRKASRKKRQAETLEDCRDNVGTMSRADKNRIEENRIDKNRVSTSSAYAETSADESAGQSSRTEKPTGTSQNTADKAKAETSETKLTPKSKEAEDSLCPNQPKDLETDATGGRAGSVGPQASSGRCATADGDEAYPDGEIYPARDAGSPEGRTDRARSGHCHSSDDCTKTAKKKPKAFSVPACPHKDIAALYHEILPELRSLKVWNSTREKRLRARWREDKSRQTLDWWRKYFESVRQSDFLMGRKTDWSADFDWLICPTNMAKVLEGRYRSVPHAPSLPEGLADRLEALFRDLVSAWPADRAGDTKEARRLFFALFSPDVLADKARANGRLSNIEAWAQVVLGRDAQYVPRLDRWMSGLDPDIAPAAEAQKEEVA